MRSKFFLGISTATMVVGLNLLSPINSVLAFNPEHLRRLIQSGECQGCDLSNADLSGQNLEGNDFKDSNLRGANLSGADLSQATLQGADLTGANLTGAKLRRVALWRSILREVDLRNADLRGASLIGNDLQGMNLQGINLQGASLDGVNLQGADLRGANLRQARFTSVDLRGANLTGADILNTSTTTINAPGIDRIKAMAKERNATLVMYSLRDRCRDVFQFCKSINSRNQAYLQDSQLYIWVIKPTGEITFRAVELTTLLKPRNITLDTLVVNSREGIGIRGLDNKSSGIRGQNKQQDRPKNRQLQGMYQLLIAPIADQLPQKAEDKVIFIPQGALFMVPFAALQDAEGNYLIEKHTIMMIPSLSMLEVTKQQRQSHGQFSLRDPKALVVGNPTMPRLQLNDREEALATLPGAEIEAREVASLLNTQPLIGSQATKNAVRQQMPGARIIHLATHGILEDSIGVYGAIALAPDDPSIGSTGLLHAQEILDLTLQAQLVVLSACNTAGGKISGDGVAGLARSFIAAGVPTVVASIWSVPDAPTASLMTNFYQNLAQDPDISQALRQAMLTTMQEFPQPRDWAAFILIGEAN